MTREETNNLQNEAYDHLWNGRYRMALTAAEKVFKERPDESEAAICLAWALLENGNPVKAMDYANLAVELKGNTVKARLYRGYLLMRMSIFEGALADFDQTIENQKELLAWSYLNKARALAGFRKFEEASKVLDLAIAIDKGKNPGWKDSKLWYVKAKKLSENNLKISSKFAKELLENAKEAIKAKEFWFTLLVSRKIIESQKLKKEKDEAELLELEAMFHLFQYKPALKKAEKLKSKFKKDEKFNNLYNLLAKYSKEENAYDFEVEDDDAVLAQDEERIIDKIDNRYKDDSIYFPNDFSDIFSIKVFDVNEESKTGERIYYKQFNKDTIQTVGTEVIFNNLFYEKDNKSFNCTAVWYLNDFEIGKNNFTLNVKSSWDSVIFVQSWGSDKKDYWKKGQAKVEIYIDNFKVCEKWFVIGNKDIEEVSETAPPLPPPVDKKKKPEQPIDYKVEKENTKSLKDLLKELDGFIGLNNIKDSVKEFIDFLEFQKERKKLGLKSQEGLSVNAVFLGNPGTGKTTVARLLGNIFRAMGILKRGHVIEVDRSSLVGQYIGETAQKTEKVIRDAMGGVLFIDEAYSLVKKGGTAQDFGQEAIDILLKRMEDHKGEFAVIVAGYPEEMNDFLNSNPGLKSRFTKYFNFDDYSPTEMIEIFKLLTDEEEYKIEEDALELLKKEFTTLYRNRDKTFGNARVAKRFFEDAKISLSKRCLKLPEKKRNKELMTKIIADDIKTVLKSDTKDAFKIPINKEQLSEAIEELDSLIGLDSVKKEMRDMVKLANYYAEEGENLTEKFSSHTMFLGNPGTGKTTVARIYSKIYSALGILPRGHLVETDRSDLVSGYVGQTSEKTNKLVDSSLGGTLFIDEAYSLVKKDDGGKDFGKEALDILLKRMEDDKGKFITIAAGYTEEMKNFVDSNPGIKSRFTKFFHFEDYNPDELMHITKKYLSKDSLDLSGEAKEKLLQYYNEIYRNRDEKFGNARIVRNILEVAKHKMLLRIAELPPDKRTEKISKIIEFDDLHEIIREDTGAKKYQIKGDPEKLDIHLKELDELTGLENIKAEIQKLIRSLKVAKLRRERGLQVFERSLHSVFMGNPGTGKTTVARLISKIYKELGVIERGHLIEVDRADLVAGYQGQTSIKTDKIIQQAIGGTLFIDEAYTLSRGSKDFGQEAIDTLLKRMEDNKGQFVVITAGYPDEMKEFIECNPGLRSRFTNFFDFDDYKPRQLLEIAAEIAYKNGYKMDEGALQLMLEIFTKLYKNRDKNFGNARTARDVLYKAISFQEERISKMYDYSDEDLMTIIFEDVDKVEI